eukprot:TRINITY_DN79983_c0_g1_i4.p2 TRINITY_DN79983_c0_g1~~TRINITY_DN79983_c0_g1_i4.p2  ORF type:complete len:217 (-),score=32.26 TRINITY_DN79983_c0_g1_i4:221-871(-)
MVRKGKRVLGEDDNKVQNTENIDIDDIALEDDGTETDGEGGSNKESRVMFIGGIPHGFYEQQIRKYFGQFGVVKKVRLSRRPKDLRCRGYGFVQFAYPSVAKIAAEAMDGYFMFKQRLRCHIVPREKIHKLMFKGHDKRIKLWQGQRLRIHKEEEPLSRSKKWKLRTKNIDYDNTCREQLKELGVEYEYTSLEDLILQKQEQGRLKKEQNKEMMQD